MAKHGKTEKTDSSTAKGEAFDAQFASSYGRSVDRLVNGQPVPDLPTPARPTNPTISDTKPVPTWQQDQ